MKKPSFKILAVATLCLPLFLFVVWRSSAPHESEQAAPSQPSPAELAATVSAYSSQLLSASQSASEPTANPLPQFLLELAAERKRLLRELIERDPLAALDLAFSYAEYESLPPELQALVERPFSQQADYRVLAICYDDSRLSHQEQSIRLNGGPRLALGQTPYSRLPVSKRGIPLQGIELGDIAVVRPGVFQKLTGDDLVWAQANLPLANRQPEADFADGSPIGANPIWAVSGGFLFTFASSASLDELETQLALLDAKPGLRTGSSSLLAQLQAPESQPLSLPEFFELQAAAALPAPDEVRDYLVIRVEFSDIAGAPYTEQEIESLVENNVAPALQTYSYNKTTVAVQATSSVFTIGASTDYLDTQASTFDTDSLHADAVAAYMNAGNANPSATYEVVSVLFPKLGVSWAGLADVGGPDQWLNGAVQADTVLHELGHNYGLSHASYWQFDATNANSTNPVDPTGMSEEYGDIFDVMGDGTVDKAHFHMGAKNYLGWLSNSDVTTIDSPASNGTYRLYAFDSVGATGNQALRVSKNGSSEYYWVGYRSAYPGIANFDKGAYLVWQRSAASNNRTWLVDTTPGSDDGKTDAGLALGKTYSDTAAQAHITPLATGQDANGSYLDVAVNLGDFAGNQAPSGTLTAPSSGEARTGVSFSFSGSDPDGDELSYHWDFGDGTVEQSLASVDHEFPVGGSYTLTLTVSDRKGGTSVYQASIEVSDPVTQITQRTSGTASDLTAIAANEAVVVVAGHSGTFLSSADGAIWANRSLGGNSLNLRTRDILWTGSSFLAVGSDWNGSFWVGVVFSSVDGTSWTEELRTTESVGDWGFISIAEDPVTNTSVVVQSDGRVRRRDTEGNFTVVDFGLQNGGWLDGASVVWTGTSFVLGAYDYSQGTLDQRLTIYRSADGVDWTRVPSADSGLLGWYGLSDVAYLNDSLLGSGFAAGLVYSTDDGETWQNNSGNTDGIASVFAYGNGIFAAHGTYDPGSGAGAQDFLSIDGRNWQRAGDPGFVFNDRAFFANTFISVADGGLIYQSESFEPPVQSPFEAWIVGFTTNEADQGSLANPDFDWAPNFIEFALGSDPTDGASVPTPPTLSLQSNGTIVVDIPRFAKTDVTLSLEQSLDLVYWEPLPAIVTADTAALLQLLTTQSYSSSEAIFIRIKASQ